MSEGGGSIAGDHNTVLALGHWKMILPVVHVYTRKQGVRLSSTKPHYRVVWLHDPRMGSMEEHQTTVKGEIVNKDIHKNKLR